MKTKIKTNKKNIKKWIIIISFVFVLLNCGQVVVAADITAQRMIELTNRSREESGFLPLKVNNKLVAAAEAKANDMFKFQYFDHNSPSGVTPWYWIKSAGYDYLYAGENLAIDFVTAEGTHMALMRSITHRDNILKPNYTEIGIAVKKGIFDGNESIIIVEEFGAPLEKIVEENNENKIDIVNIDIKRDADVNSQEGELKKIEETKKIEKAEDKLVEIKSPIVYFRDENYEKNKNEESKDDENKDDNEVREETIETRLEEELIVEIIAEGTSKEFVFPIMFRVENIKPLDKTLTENIFWEEYQEEEKGIFGKIISFFNYKFLFIKACVFV